jgi:hypothetical protein
VLRSLHLRVYTTADYVAQWNRLFGWASSDQHVPAPCSDALTDVAAVLRQKGITGRALARGIGADSSFVAKVVAGKKPWPTELRRRALDWIAAQSDPLPPASGRQDTAVAASDATASPRLMPLIAAAIRGERPMLDVAMEYLRRGWSVVPQMPRAKRPCVRWKPFQDRLPTVEELTDWFAQWPDAGLGVVLGPVSGLFVVDVDGTEAHEVLLAQLGSVPVAPRAISGSRSPDRYHLFFRCPQIPTKAKATPWHPKLEFRGKGGIVVIAPSLHPSGRRYAWDDGCSPDDHPLPDVPAKILEALTPRTTTLTTAPLSTPALPITVAPSTQEYLSGRYAEGPGWNDRLFRATCDLAGRGMSRADAEPLLLAGARPRDASNREMAQRTIASAYSQPREPGCS